MTTVTLPLTGRCQCGELAYRLSAAPYLLYCCHCTNCQKQTGSAFVLSCAVPMPAFEFTQGEPARFEWEADSGTKRFGLLCGGCGTRIVNGQEPSNGIYSLRAGTLDDTSWVRPAGHIWLRSAQGWFRAAEEDLVYDQQPTDYGPMMARFAGFQTFVES